MKDSARVTCYRAALVSVLLLLEGVDASRRKLTQKDGILPSNFNDALDSILPNSSYTLTPNASPAQCQEFANGVGNTCKTALSAQTALYLPYDKAHLGLEYNVTICTCKGGPYNTKGLADLVARLPEYLLYWVDGVTSLPSSPGSGAAALTWAQAAQIIVFGETRTRTLVHEAGHSQDLASGLRQTTFTSTDAWKKAVQSSSCKATAYSGTPGVGINEEYAEDMMIYTYNLYRGNKYPSFDTHCLEPELKALASNVESINKTIFG